MSIRNGFSSLRLYLYTGYYKRFFSHFGENSKLVPKSRLLIGMKYISVGCDCIIGSNIQLTAYDHYQSQKFSPEIIIKDGVQIGDGAHITCINRVIIGNNVLTWRHILITDNSHGSSKLTHITDAPVKRDLFSKGETIIEDNVWIGEKVSIIGGVTIGESSIIGANTVVTKDVPAYSLVVGSPMRIIKLL